MLQYNSKVRIVLYHYCKKFYNSGVYNFLMQTFLSHEMPKKSLDITLTFKNANALRELVLYS